MAGVIGYIVKFTGEVKDLDRKGNIKLKVDSVKVMEDDWLEGFADLALVNDANVARRIKVAQGDLLNFFKD